MPVTITDISNRKHERYLKHIGISGKKYVFEWDRQVGRYVYEAANQTEIDDLAEGSKMWGTQHFSCLMPPESASATKQAVKRAVRKPRAPKTPVPEKQTVGRSAFEPTL